MGYVGKSHLRGLHFPKYVTIRQHRLLDNIEEHFNPSGNTMIG